MSTPDYQNGGVLKRNVPGCANTWQDRVYSEKSELEAKMRKLIAFLKNVKYGEISDEDEDLLEQQLSVMEEYSDVLARRIRRF